MDFDFEKKLKQNSGYKNIAGLDEVGRGPLAGPVTVGAFLFLDTLPKSITQTLKDSKLLSPQQREELYKYFCELKQEGKVDFATSSCFPVTVDKKQIHHASVIAMRRAIKKLKPKPDFAVVDSFPYSQKIFTGFEYKKLKGADNIVPSVSAASVVAKVRRDRSMSGYYHKKYPEYRFDLHKGYGTAMHYKMLRKHGPSPIHRKSFRLA